MASTAAANAFRYTITSLAGNFGRLWKPSHESLSSGRRILQVHGPGATDYLQALVTCDLTQPPLPPREESSTTTTVVDVLDSDAMSDVESSPTTTSTTTTSTPLVEFSDKLRATCFLDSKGRIVTDALLWKVDNTHYYVDVPDDTADTLFAHLKTFILRRTKVKVQDVSTSVGGGVMSSHVVFGTMNAQGTPEGYLSAADPRHPSLGLRVLSLTATSTQQFEPMMKSVFPTAPGTYHVVRKLAGVAEGLELQGKVAGETNQEFLNAVSFSKGCYLGQELTARVQFTGAIRKRVMPIMLMDLNMELPRPWLMASQVQQGKTPDVLLLEEDNEGNNNNNNKVESSLPRLPRLSPSAVGSIIGMMCGSSTSTSTSGDDNMDAEEKKNEDAAHSSQQSSSLVLAAQSEALMKGLQHVKMGDKLVDSSDGKTIGQIIAPPEPGTNVVLAQVRLDRVGLLGDGVWTHTNKVKVGDLGEFRYLPYLPLWWPEIDRESGKAKQPKDDEEDEDEEELD